MQLFIGVEGIAMRYSVAVAADESGRVLAAHRAVGDPLSLHTTSRRELRSRIKELLRALLGQLGLTLATVENTSICLGITGVTFPFDAGVDLPPEFRNHD